MPGCSGAAAACRGCRTAPCGTCRALNRSAAPLRMPRLATGEKRPLRTSFGPRHVMSPARPGDGRLYVHLHGPPEFPAFLFFFGAMTLQTQCSLPACLPPCLTRCPAAPRQAVLRATTEPMRLGLSPALRRGRGAHCTAAAEASLAVEDSSRIGGVWCGRQRARPSLCNSPPPPHSHRCQAASNSSQVSADTAASRHGSSLLLSLTYSAVHLLLPHASISCLPLLLPLGRAKSHSGDAVVGLRLSHVSPADAAQRPAPSPDVLKEEIRRARRYLGQPLFIY